MNKIPSASYTYVFEADKKSSIETVKERDNYKFLTAKQNRITFTTEEMIGYCSECKSLEEDYKEK